jgi:hypothetical protein
VTTPAWHTVPLAFEVTADDGERSYEHVLTITSVQRDDYAIRVNYEIAPPIVGGQFGPGGEAKDDVGNEYEDSGGVVGPTGNYMDGTLSFPLPAAEATELRALIEWRDLDDAWEVRPVDVRVILRDR